jgi:hypothetical protein
MKSLTINKALLTITNRYPQTKKYISLILDFKAKYPKIFNVSLFLISFLVIYNFGKMVGEIVFYLK